MEASVYFKDLSPMIKSNGQRPVDGYCVAYAKKRRKDLSSSIVTVSP